MRRGRALRHPDRSAPRLGLRFAVGTGHLCQIKFWLMQLIPSSFSSLPARLVVCPRRLAPRGPRPWPARDRRPVGRLRDLEVFDASNVLDNAVGCVVPPGRSAPMSTAVDSRLLLCVENAA